MKQPRDITKVIDAMAAVAPELTEILSGPRRQAAYTAPEVARDLWCAAGELLVAWSKTAPKETVDRVGRIWADLVDVGARS